MFGRWERSERALLVACAEMYFQGVSTRNVREVLESMCGGDVSAATVTVLSFPGQHRMRLTSTNMLENLMKRLKKRTRSWGVPEPGELRPADRRAAPSEFM